MKFIVLPLLAAFAAAQNTTATINATSTENNVITTSIIAPVITTVPTVAPITTSAPAVVTTTNFPVVTTATLPVAISTVVPDVTATSAAATTPAPVSSTSQIVETVVTSTWQDSQLIPPNTVVVVEGSPINKPSTNFQTRLPKIPEVNDAQSVMAAGFFGSLFAGILILLA